MESKAVLPLPPGMVPSSSREDMSALKDLELKEEEREDSVLKKVWVAQLDPLVRQQATLAKK